ncbi:hypothetical protein [Legionella jordanis]|uniref:Tfp pilus assembly protein PilW n=1 Tax=Legionella jordanis TaxID=456 RepID=A0A0W0VEA8_9GAMM|nr:hypothetical protein [Legionella jordanis]KTD18468.1 hypothetical protein Ljor_2774 [Legionella jordanis]RMX05373.1 hypothetical protein EAW55_01555 [Legionella jordanis]RMX20779.1 hypothetical protein EAS68_05510 [Legionella jordanis]VEH13184.1 Tfp pilus assembly protein PilW [Legionella jordanis]HAT8715040.1 hypothetical protein [Legionella jordanis]
MIHQRGIGLVELLLSLFLASVLICLLIEHYINAKKHYEQGNKRLEQAYELSMLEELFRKSIQQAGFSPCLSMPYLNANSGDPGEKIKSIEITGGQNTNLRINRMSEHFSRVFQMASDELWIIPGEDYEKDEWIIIADCSHMEVKQIASIAASNNKKLIRLKKPLQFSYTMPVYLGQWISEQYFIKNNTSGENTLYYQNGSHSEELSSIVQSLSVVPIDRSNANLIQVSLGLKQEHVLLEIKIRAS